MVIYYEKAVNFYQKFFKKNNAYVASDGINDHFKKWELKKEHFNFIKH